MSGPPEAGVASSLEACPDWVVEGMTCATDPGLSCFLTDDTTCHCAYPDGSDRSGVVVCGSTPPPPPPGGICGDDVRTGAHCDADGPRECRHDCFEEMTCRCVPESDIPGCAYVWLCEGSSEPPPPTDICTDDDLRRCRDDGFAECSSADGRRCRCERDGDASGSADGDFRITCDGDPTAPPPDDVCSPSDYDACRAGMAVDCSFDGRDCHCVPDSDSADGFYAWCDDPASTPPPPPPGGDRCSDVDVSRCAAGEEVRCVRDDGVECRCGATADGDVGFVCG